MHVEGKAIELCHHDRGFRLPGLRQSLAQLRSALEGVTRLPRLDLDMLGDDLRLSAAEKRVIASRCAGNAETERPWVVVETRM